MAKGKLFSCLKFSIKVFYEPQFTIPTIKKFPEFKINNHFSKIQIISRGIRKAYKEDFLTEMMTSAYDQWADLEKDCKIQLLKYHINIQIITQKIFKNTF